MKIKIEYWNTITNEKIVRNNDFEWEEESHILYQYKYGNYSCDCNRSLFMYDWDENKELECSEDSPIIKTNIYNQENGKLIYREY